MNKSCLVQLWFENDITDISVISMATDFEGNIWCGTNQSGIFKVDPITEKITHYQSVATSKGKLISNGIRCVHVDKQNRLWIAYMNSGFGYMNLKTNSIN
ncbi:MAG: two-component regulator propeller domain-containing protein [Eubacteriales bacterium]